MVLSLGASMAAAQEVDPIGALLEQGQTPPPTPPAAEAIPTSPPPQAPVAPVSPPPAAYVPPPVYTPPPAVQAPLPYVNTPPAYTPPVYTPPPYAPPAYVPPRSRRPQLTAPVHIDEIDKTPEAPPTATDLSYEARMRSSFNSAQGMQGPLDGAWSLKAGGSELYDLQVVDSGSGNLEGAWRDPRRRGATDASGFIDTISRVGGQLIIRLTPRPGAEAVVITLSADGAGTWSGELIERGDRRSVTMRRN